MISETNSKPNFIAEPFINNDYQSIFDEFYIPLCRHAMKFVSDFNKAEDIVQESFIYLWENWERLKNIDNIKAYLFTAVKNLSLTNLQKQFFSIQLREIDDNDFLFSDQKQPTALELLECNELELILEKALESLPKKCRIIFIQKRFAEKSNKEIAEYLNISVKTVEAQMTIAIKRLTAFVNKRWSRSSKLILFLLLKGLKK